MGNRVGCRAALAAALALAWGTFGCEAVPTASAVDSPWPSAEPSRATGPVQQAEVPNFSRVIVRQQTPVWCWAACAEMVNRYYRRPGTQAEIAQRIATVRDENADAQRRAEQIEVLAALEPKLYEKLTERWDSDFSRSWLVQMDLWLPGRTESKSGPDRPQLKFDADTLIEHIESRSPVVVGLGGDRESDSRHIVVVHRVEYEPIAARFDLLNKPSQYRIRRVEYADPDGGINATMTGDELARRTDFFATRRGASQYLTYINARYREMEIERKKSEKEWNKKRDQEEREKKEKDRRREADRMEKEKLAAAQKAAEARAKDETKPKPPRRGVKPPVVDKPRTPPRPKANNDKTDDRPPVKKKKPAESTKKNPQS